MEELNMLDFELIKKAKEVIKKNYDGLKFNHTVGSALRCKDGSVYVGVNVYSIHGACAEQVALGNAITNGKREFDTIVAINGENGEIMSPCGNCRQIFSDYMPHCSVIIKDGNGLKKIKASELIPYSYHAQY